jgi:hypothetical protein
VTVSTIIAFDAASFTCPTSLSCSSRVGLAAWATALISQLWGGQELFDASEDAVLLLLRHGTTVITRRSIMLITGEECWLIDCAQQALGKRMLLMGLHLTKPPSSPLLKAEERWAEVDGRQC